MNRKHGNLELTAYLANSYLLESEHSIAYSIARAFLDGACSIFMEAMTSKFARLWRTFIAKMMDGKRFPDIECLVSISIISGRTS